MGSVQVEFPRPREDLERTAAASKVRVCRSAENARGLEDTPAGFVFVAFVESAVPAGRVSSEKALTPVHAALKRPHEERERAKAVAVVAKVAETAHTLAEEQSLL